MSKNSMNMERDATWDFFSHIGPDYFDKLVGYVEFSPQVPEKIVSKFEKIKALLRGSYMNYEFLEVAKDQTLLQLEFALKLRYEEFTGEVPEKRITLFRLIEWAHSEYLFEENIESVHALRHIRNWSAHPDPNFTYKVPGFAISMVMRIVNIINGLYSDIKLRVARLSEIDRVKSLLGEFGDYHSNGAILELPEHRLIVYIADTLYFHNEGESQGYYFLFYPLFYPVVSDDGKSFHTETLPRVLHCKTVHFTSDSIVFTTSKSSTSIVLHRLKKEENKAKFSDWKEQVQDSIWSAVIHSRIEDLFYRASLQPQELQKEGVIFYS